MFPTHATMGELYDPAMKITDQDEADAYFQGLVKWHVERWGKLPAEAETIVKSNLGYYAGYWDADTRRRVERLFKCEHPVFGSIAKNGQPTPEAAFAAGVKAGLTTICRRRSE
jgi:hypothetical protein